MSGASQERARAARTLVGIIYRGKTTDQSFGSDAEISPLTSELVYGTLRHYILLEPLVQQFLEKPFRTKDLDLRALLIVGAYQLKYMRIPDHAAINETVNACRALKKPWARGLINAVLRKIAADKEKVDPTERLYGLPEWIYDRLENRFPDSVQRLAEASLERAPMSLRVKFLQATSAEENKLPETIAASRDALLAAGITAHPGWFPEQLILEQPVPARKLPGYAEGLLSIQDGGALFAAEIICTGLSELEHSEPLRILDACAAPGGKLFHLAERLAGADLTGVEISPERLDHMQQEAERLGHKHIHLLQGDATGTDWIVSSSTTFDAILLDAPCSGSGTLRRHPDIKILRKPEDLPAYAALQRQLLDNLWQQLAPNGTFLYCTCSLFEEENDTVLEGFLAEHSDAVLEPISLPLGTATRFGWQLLPLPSGGEVPNRTVDGFYFARMTRREKAR